MQRHLQKYMKAWQFGSTVVVDKSQIIGAKDDEFEPVALVIPAESIKEWYEELDVMGDLEDEEEDES